MPHKIKLNYSNAIDQPLATHQPSQTAKTSRGHKVKTDHSNCRAVRHADITTLEKTGPNTKPTREKLKGKNSTTVNVLSPTQNAKIKKSSNPAKGFLKATASKIQYFLQKAVFKLKTLTSDSSGEKTAQRNLKRAVIDLLISKKTTSGNETIASMIAKSDSEDLMNIPKLINELPSLYPSKSQKKLMKMKQALTQQWMSLEAGHEWGIKLKYFLGNKRQSTESNYTVITTTKAAELTSNFLKKESINENLISMKGLKRVNQSTLSGAKAVQRANTYNLRALLNPFNSNTTAGKELLNNLNTNGIINIPCGWSNHAVGMTIHKAQDGKYFLYYCNRGGRGFEKAEDRALMGNQDKNGCNMVCFEIQNISALTPKLLGKIVGTCNYTADPKKTDPLKKSFLEGNEGIIKLLNLKKVGMIPKTAQKIGNCSWANTKGSVHAALVSAAYDELHSKNCGKDSLSRLNDAINSGTTVFKKMERFGRKQSLEPFLKYDALGKGAEITPFDHLRVLSAAGQKLAKKMNEAKNSNATHSDDQQMSERIIKNLNSCQYPISSISHPSNIRHVKLYQALKKAGDGSYTFIGNTCITFKEGSVQTIGTFKSDQSLEAVLKDIGTKFSDLRLTLPVMLNHTSPINAHKRGNRSDP